MYINTNNFLKKQVILNKYYYICNLFKYYTYNYIMKKFIEILKFFWFPILCVIYFIIYGILASKGIIK
jgi:hypothetical protein